MTVVPLGGTVIDRPLGGTVIDRPLGGTVIDRVLLKLGSDGRPSYYPVTFKRM